MKKSTMRISLSLTTACLMLFVLMAAAPSPNTTANTVSAVPVGFSGGTQQGGVYISFTLPKGWHTKTARVGIVVEDTCGIGIDKVEAKAVQNGSWTDITDTLYLDISDNGTIYVQVTDRAGNVTAKSVYVECFDREKPTVRASRNGRLLRVEASDDLSGVAAIFVDGEEYTDFTNGTLEVRINSRDNPDEKIWIQAKDNAGNISATYSMTNPYYTDPDKKVDTSSASSQESAGETSSGNSTTTTLPDGGGSTTSAPASSTASTTNSQQAGSGTAVSETGSDGENKDGGVIAVGDKQFITIETRDGKIFYLIIDGERESDNVYLVTEVTTQDLQSFTTDEASPDNSGSSSGTSGAANANGTPDADTDTLIDGGVLPGRDDAPGDDGLIDIGGDNSSGAGEESESGESSPDAEETGATVKKGNPIPGWIVIIILLCIAAFAGYMFLVVLPRKKAKEAYLEDEDEADEDEYMEETYDTEPEELPDDSGEPPAGDFTDGREDDIFNVDDEDEE